MALEHLGPTRDPWSSSSREEFDNPNWEPLALVVGGSRVTEFMWMGRVCGDDWSLELYKHRHSRRYLNIDLAGNTYCYTESRYVPIATSTALRHVFRERAC